MIKTLLPLLVIVGIIIAIKFIIENFSNKSKGKPDLSDFIKKQYLFDTTSEFNLYKVLLELFGDKYYIFPQINYSHLIEPRKSTYQEERKNRSRIDRKSADFVMCDKDKIIPLIAIELDGSIHNTQNKKEKDEIKDAYLEGSGLHVIHLKNSDVGNKDFIKSEINNKLGL